MDGSGRLDRFVILPTSRLDALENQIEIVYAVFSFWRPIGNLTRHATNRLWAKALLFLAILAAAAPAQQSSIPRFEVTLPAAYKQPVTGRVFVIVARSDSPEPRLQAGTWRSGPPVIGADARALQPGATVPFRTSTL